MGQKVSPIGFRTGVTIGWQSRWFAPKSNFGEFLVEDERIRRFIDNRLNRQPPYAAISAVEIERTREEVKLAIKTARPGLVIGPKGAEVEKLREALEHLTDRRVNINIVEVRSPDLDARLVAESIAEQLKRRGNFRRILKQRAEATMQAGAKGVKIIVSGRLGGREIARSEAKILGSIPLHTLEADVDYGFAPSFTTYGTIGVKVWIYRGMFGEEEEQPTEQRMTRVRRRQLAVHGDREPSDLGPTGRGPGGRGKGRAQAPKAQAPKPGAPKPGAPKAEAPKAEAPKPGAPKAEAPKAGAPKAEAPKAEAPAEEAPATEDKPAPPAAEDKPATPGEPAPEADDKRDSGPAEQAG